MIQRPKQLRKFLGISESTYYRMKRQGVFPEPVVLSARIYGFRSEDIEQWLTQRQLQIKEVSPE